MSMNTVSGKYLVWDTLGKRLTESDPKYTCSISSLLIAFDYVYQVQFTNRFYIFYACSSMQKSQGHPTKLCLKLLIWTVSAYLPGEHYIL